MVRRRVLLSDRMFGLALTAPALLVIVGVILYPLIYSFLLSFRTSVTVVPKGVVTVVGP